MHAQNLLLESLSGPVRKQLQAHLDYVDLPQRRVLYNVDETPTHVHFLLSGVASIVTTMEDGDAVEAGVIGREAFPEHLHLLGPQHGTTHCYMQVAGAALRMPFERFQNLFLQEPELLSAVHRFVQHEALALAQLGACNRLHKVEERLARWLLMVCDRVGQNELGITQEALAQMIGSRRPSVNLAAGTLQKAGIISYQRGRVILTDVKALQAVACECYPILRNLYRMLYR